jgi:Tfp pilus assembly major pilin PilA
MKLTATIAGAARSPLLSGSSVSLRRPVSSATLVLDDPLGTLSVGLLDEVFIEIEPAIIENSGLPGAMLPGAWLPGGELPPAPTVVPERLFDGFVSAIDIDPYGKPPGRLLKVDCLDWNWRLDHPPGFLTKAYLGASDRTIILDALSALGLSDIVATTSTIEEIETDLTIAFRGATMRDVLEEVTRANGAVWWVDGRTLRHNTVANATAAAWAINTDAPNNSTTYDVLSLGVASRHDRPLNAVTVEGPPSEGERPSASASDATSISAIGRYEALIEIDSVTTNSYAQTVADSLVAAGKDPRETIRFRFSDEDGRPHLTVNQKILATSARFGLSAQAFVTREVRIHQERSTISHFAVDAGDFRPTVTDMLRRLEIASRSSAPSVRKIRGLDFAASSSESVESGTTTPNLDNLAEFSVFATVRVDAIGSDRTIAAKDTGSNLGWRFQITSVGNLRVVRTREFSNYDYIRLWPGGLELGRVYRIVVTSSATTGARFWVDGVQATTLGGSSIGTGDFDAENGSPFRVGRRTSGNYFDGFIGAVAVWDFALPTTTANKLHNASFGALPFASNLAVAYALDEFAESASALGTDTIRDRSGNNYHGTPQNTPTGDAVVYVGD